jgi:hypothetical protein
LPEQYARHARTVQGLQKASDIDAFVKSQLDRIRQRIRSGEDLEQELFFSNYRFAPVRSTGGLPKQGAARFPGCAYCHEVKNQNASVVVTPPSIPDRWLAHADFNHARHSMVQCATCHAVKNSSSTADIMIPGKASCIQCHSPKGGISQECLTCHRFHHQPDEMITGEPGERMKSSRELIIEGTVRGR